MIKKEDLKLVNETIKAFKQKHKKSQPIERRTGAAFLSMGTPGRRVGIVSTPSEEPPFRREFENVGGVSRRTHLNGSHVDFIGIDEAGIPIVRPLEATSLYGIESSTYVQWQSQPQPVPLNMNTLVGAAPRNSTLRNDLENHIRSHTREEVSHFTGMAVPSNFRSQFRAEYNESILNHIQAPPDELTVTVTEVDQANRTVTVSSSPANGGNPPEMVNHVEDMRQRINELSISWRPVVLQPETGFEYAPQVVDNSVAGRTQIALDLYNAQLITTTEEILSILQTPTMGRWPVTNNEDEE